MTADYHLDVIKGNGVYILGIYVINMIDQITIEKHELLYKVPQDVPNPAKDDGNFD
jgi:ribosome-interacting GTPase 1